MIQSGRFFGSTEADWDITVVREATVTDDSIVFDCANDDPFYAVLHSSDGRRYAGTFGEPNLNPNCTIEGERFRSVSGEELLWGKWHDKNTGHSGIFVVHLNG